MGECDETDETENGAENCSPAGVEYPLSRSQPAGKAMPAWKNTQTLRIQKVLLCVHP